MSQSIYVIMRKRSDGKILLEMEKCGGRFFFPQTKRRGIRNTIQNIITCSRSLQISQTKRLMRGSKRYR